MDFLLSGYWPSLNMTEVEIYRLSPQRLCFGAQMFFLASLLANNQPFHKLHTFVMIRELSLKDEEYLQ
jgi:hypothetical protein